MIPNTISIPVDLRLLGAGTLQFWIESDLGVDVSAGTQLANLARDQSGQSNDSFAAANANRLTYVPNVQNGQASLQGGGAATGFSINPAVANGLTATFMMAVSPSAAVNAYLMSDVGNLTAFLSNFGGLSYEWFNGADRYTLSAGATGPHIITVTQNGLGVNGLNGYLDGALVFTHTAGVALGNINTIMNDSALAAGATADFFGASIWSSVLNANDLADAHSYWKQKLNL